MGWTPNVFGPSPIRQTSILSPEYGTAIDPADSGPLTEQTTWSVTAVDENTKAQSFILMPDVLIGASGYLGNSLFL